MHCDTVYAWAAYIFSINRYDSPSSCKMLTFSIQCLLPFHIFPLQNGVLPPFRRAFPQTHVLLLYVNLRSICDSHLGEGEVGSCLCLKDLTQQKSGNYISMVTREVMQPGETALPLPLLPLNMIIKSLRITAAMGRVKSTITKLSNPFSPARWVKQPWFSLVKGCVCVMQTG